MYTFVCYRLLFLNVPIVLIREKSELNLKSRQSVLDRSLINRPDGKKFLANVWFMKRVRSFTLSLVIRLSLSLYFYGLHFINLTPHENRHTSVLKIPSLKNIFYSLSLLFFFFCFQWFFFCLYITFHSFVCFFVWLRHSLSFFHNFIFANNSTSAYASENRTYSDNSKRVKAKRKLMMIYRWIVRNGEIERQEFWIRPRKKDRQRK